MTISGGRTKERYNCRFSAASLALRVIFFSFIVMEHIRFFHIAPQLLQQSVNYDYIYMNLNQTARLAYTCTVISSMIKGPMIT